MLFDLRELYPFRMKLHERGFVAKEVIAPGGDFYDVLLGWRNPADGSIVFNDIGGQKERGWDPEKGHGALWRLHRDNRLEVLVPYGNVARYALIHIIKGEQQFGDSEGDVFIVAQTGPGRLYASRAHCVLRVRPGMDRPELFASVRDAGTINGGHAGAMMPDVIAPKGSPFEGFLFIHSLMNCTIYRVSPQGGEAEVFINFDGDRERIMPFAVRIAPSWWGDLAGDLVMAGARDAHFHSADVKPEQRGFWRILPNRAVEPINPPPIPLSAKQAPATFGPFAGHLFWADDGPVQLGTVAGCDRYADSLPYAGRILRMSPDGQVHVFAADFYGSYTSIEFDGARLIIELCGRSYSTGEFHEPDGSLYEIRFTG
jgi:hypothetical protein